MNLLVTSAGRRNQLIACFREDAAQLALPLRVLAVDHYPESSPACLQADARFAVPHCTDAGYAPRLLDLCAKHEVGLLVPTIDPELRVLSAHREAFAAIGTHVVVSAPEVVALCQHKQRSAERLAAAGIATPKTLGLADYLRDPAQLRDPVIAKPNGGSASLGIVRPGHPGELAALDPRGYIVQELWQGREYTVNVFFDRTGHLHCAVPHERLEVRAGEVSKGVTRRLASLAKVAWQLPELLPGASGPLCFQAIVTASGETVVFEINARFGGGYPLAHRAGARMSQWLLEEAAGLPLSAHDDWREGVTMLRYDTAIFVDE
jgi:carbamoyl-phosphate synthase large subunit